MNTEMVVQQDLDYICRNLKEELAQMSGKRVLITGGAGFLGYYLLQALLHAAKVDKNLKPIEVVVLDNAIRGLPGWFRQLLKEGRFTFLQQDITKPLTSALGAYQYIIHAASIASPTFYRQFPIETMDANVNGLRQLLEYSRAHLAKILEGFLYFSSSEIYGDPSADEIPTKETYRGNVSCTGPRACYDESKRYGETLCVNFAEQHHLPVKIVRPFNNFGPGLLITDKRVIPDFASNILNNQDIVILSNGDPTRTFCYVADAVVGYVKVLVRGHQAEPYNIGVDKPEISMRQLAEEMVAMARELWGYQGKVVFKQSTDQEYLTDSPNRRCPVIEKARLDLAYQPGIDLKEGLRRSLNWYRHYQDGVKP